jgi:hypothetical protein
MGNRLFPMYGLDTMGESTGCIFNWRPVRHRVHILHRLFGISSDLYPLEKALTQHRLYSLHVPASWYEDLRFTQDIVEYLRLRRCLEELSSVTSWARGH